MLPELDVDLLIWVPCLVGLVYCVISWKKVAAIVIDGHQPKDGKTGLSEPLKPASNGKPNSDNQWNPKTMGERAEEIKRLQAIVSDGAMAFLFAEYKVMGIYVVLFSGLLMVTFALSDANHAVMAGLPTTICFIVGAITSIVAGYIGMRIAVYTNGRVAHECYNKDDVIPAPLAAGFKVAIDGGAVMGISLVSLGVIFLAVLIKVLPMIADYEDKQRELYEAIAGYGLGGSSIALFGRVGGGIYTKAADVGADLAGKVDEGLEEDDPNNPGCIADNVGDNVGDIAGMGADLFGSFAEATCAALVLAASCDDLKSNSASLMYPLLVSSVGIIVGILTLMINPCVYPVTGKPDTVEKSLKGILIVSTVLMTPVAVGLSKVCLPPTFSMFGVVGEVQWYYCAISLILGLWSGLFIGVVTERYTSHSYRHVREIAETQKQSAATGIIYGLALGYLSCIVPVICLGITILIGHSLCGMFGVALAALGMLGTMTMALTIDAYGPISDNAGGLAEMAHLPECVRTLTDILDAAGNTTAAIGKGFAIGSAALVSLALFGAFTVRANVTEVNILNPWVFTGLFYGAMLPYAFAAMTMKSVGEAADELLQECKRQFPAIKAFKGGYPREIPAEFTKDNKKVTMKKEADQFEANARVDALIKETGYTAYKNSDGTLNLPQYDRCIQISTDSSIREMIAPGALVILSPLLTGFLLGKNACAGLLSGALVSSVQLAISMSNSGGAWDNSKKYISAGGLGPEHKKKGASSVDGKQYETHANSVIGDTVGDPLKDTSGPALNIVMKLTAILSLVFGSVIASTSNADGGPYWLPIQAA